MSSNDVKKAQNWIKGLMNDPLAKILSENSHLTQIQLETLLIDLLAERFIDKKMNYTEKSKMRSTDRKVCRGAFNRTLQQSRKNMMKSIWTVLLLGYFGLLETPSLTPFVEASNKLENYVNEYRIMRNTVKNNIKNENMAKMMIYMQNELKNTIYSLVKPRKTL